MVTNGRTEAYMFEFEGGGARISYDSLSRRLHYVGPSKPPLDDVVEVTETVAPMDTPIGTLLTATLRFAADSVVNTVSILLPRVNLKVTSAGSGEGPLAEDLRFQTVGVWTASFSTVGGPDLVDGPLQHYAYAELEGTARAPYVFTATLTGEPPGPGILEVVGGCTFPSSGYEVSLVRHEPQGTNPRDLLLRLVVTPPGPDDTVLPVITTYPVSYAETTEVELDTVTILPDGLTLEVYSIT
jgi:hypothetical protein